MAKAKIGDVVFQRSGQGNEQSDIWDDSVLIEAYEQAVSLAYDAVHASMKSNGEFSADELTKHSPSVNKTREREESVAGNGSMSGSEVAAKKAKKKRRSHRKKWQVGDRCLAKYSEDGQWYEAEIIAIDRSNNRCSVRYVEYENEEVVNLGMLQKVPETSMDEEDSSRSDREETTDFGGDSEEAIPWQGISHSVNRNISTVPILPPPVPPHLLRQDGVPQEDEAMASMLMSWYTSGYHTGYYQALRDMNKAKK